MRSLLAIYTTAVIVGLVTLNYVNGVVNSLIVVSAPPASSLSVTMHPHGSSVAVPNLQGGSPNTVGALQPTERVYSLQPTESTQFAQSTQGGLNMDTELQPALGYGALNWVLQ